MRRVVHHAALAGLALASGAARSPRGTNGVGYVEADPAQLQLEMMIAFDKIRAKVTSYDLTLDRSGVVDPSLVNVVFTDAHNVEHVVLEDETDGWTYDDPVSPTKVILHGASCTNLKANPSGDVEVVLG